MKIPKAIINSNLPTEAFEFLHKFTISQRPDSSKFLSQEFIDFIKTHSDSFVITHKYSKSILKTIIVVDEKEYEFEGIDLEVALWNVALQVSSRVMRSVKKIKA